jgi:hypothetical protein
MRKSWRAAIMADLKQYSILLAWSEADIDQGEFREVVRAANAEEAEAKARAAMRAWHVANYCDPGGDANDIAESCAQYEHEVFDGGVIFGGRVLDVHEGAIWKAHDLEFRLRGLLAAIDQWSSRNGWSDNGEREAARMVIAEIESLGVWEPTTSPVE